MPAKPSSADLWQKAKDAAKKSKVKEGGDRHWRIVANVWKKLNGGKKP